MHVLVEQIGPASSVIDAVGQIMSGKFVLCVDGYRIYKADNLGHLQYGVF